MRRSKPDCYDFLLGISEGALLIVLFMFLFGFSCCFTLHVNVYAKKIQCSSLLCIQNIILCIYFDINKNASKDGK